MLTPIFATPIWITHFDDHDYLRSLLNSAALGDLPTKSQDQEAYFGGEIRSGLFSWRSSDYLQPHQRSEFFQLCDFVSGAANDYWHQLSYYPDATPRICQSWITTYVPGSYIRSHNHGVNIDIVAAVYIDSTPAQGALVLEHPLELLLSTQPYKIPRDQPHKFNHAIPVSTGDIVLFPSWMKHHSEPNATDQNRVVLAVDFNRTGT